MSQVTLKGEAVSIGGTFPAPGSEAPDFLLANIKREDVSLNDYTGKKKILNIFPSMLKGEIAGRILVDIKN